MMPRAFVIVVLLLSPQETEWKAGFASVKITPEEPLPLAGYANRDKSHESVAAEIFVKALALEDVKGRRALLITADHIGWNAEVADPLAARLVEATKVPREAILLNASHSHSGPRITLTPGARSNVSEADGLKCVAYTKQLIEKTVEAAQQALSRLEPARLSWSKGAVSFPVNRRQATDRGIIIGVNRDGPVDRSVPVLRIDAPEGKLRGVVFGAACHNTTLTGTNYKVCGDYAGFAQTWLESKGVQAMFVLGCGGDANPNPRGTLDLAREYGETLGKEVWRVAQGERVAVAGPLATALEYVDLPFKKPERADAEKIAAGTGAPAGTAKQMLTFFEAGAKLPEKYRAPVAVWKFGKDLTLVALPGETVVDYALAVERIVAPARVWVAGYSNDKFGYLPSKRVAEEGGYEAQGLTKGFGGPGFFAPEVEEVILKKVRELVALP